MFMRMIIKPKNSVIGLPGKENLVDIIVDMPCPLKT